jgi:hypothetical protein
VLSLVSCFALVTVCYHQLDQVATCQVVTHRQNPSMFQMMCKLMDIFEAHNMKFIEV